MSLELKLNQAQQTIATLTIAQAQDKARIAQLVAQIAGFAAREAQADLARLKEEAKAMGEGRTAAPSPVTPIRPDAAAAAD